MKRARADETEPDADAASSVVAKRPRPATASLATLPDDLLIEIADRAVGGALIVMALVCKECLQSMLVLHRHRFVAANPEERFDAYANTFATSWVRMWASPSLLGWARRCLDLDRIDVAAIARAGHLQCIKKESCIQGDVKDLLQGACEGGRLEIVEWVCTTFDVWQLYANDLKKAVNLAAVHGHSQILQFVGSYLPKANYDDLQAWNGLWRGALYSAAVNGDLETFKICLEQLSFMSIEDVRNVVEQLVCWGASDATLGWFKNELIRRGRISASAFDAKVDEKRRNKWFQVSRLITSLDPKKTMNEWKPPVMSRHFQRAFLYRTRTIMQEIVQDPTTFENEFAKFTRRLADISKKAMDWGDSDVLRWLLQQTFWRSENGGLVDLRVIKNIRTHVVMGACLLGDLQTVSAIVEMNCHYLDYCMPNAIRSGRLELVKGVFRRLQDAKRMLPRDWCPDAAAEGHLTILQWLLEQECPRGDALERARDRKQWRVVRWLERQPTRVAAGRESC